MVLKGMMTRPSGSHRDELVMASIGITNRLAVGYSGGALYAPPDDPAECADIGNRICKSFYHKQTLFVPEEADDLLRLAQQLHVIFLDLAAGELQAAVPKINVMLAEHPPSLHLSEEPPYSLHYQDHAMSAVKGWRVGCSAALASWVSSKSTQYIRRCEALRCDRIFFDDTRNGSRRFCGVRCQDREKVRAYRLRRVLSQQSEHPATDDM
jgi:hypothetical protein